MDSYLQFVLTAVGLVFLSLGAGVIVGRKTRIQDVNPIDYASFGQIISKAIADVILTRLDDLSRNVLDQGSRILKLETTLAQSLGKCPEKHQTVDQMIDAERQARISGDISLTATCSEIKTIVNRNHDRIQVLGDIIHSER